MSQHISPAWAAKIESVGRKLIDALWHVQDWSGPIGDLLSELEDLLDEPEREEIRDARD